MKNINSSDKKLISNAVKKAELKTSGEIVPVILKQSDFYPAAHFRFALIVGIIFSLIVYYVYDFDDPIVLIWSQFPGMLVGFFMAYIPFIKRLFTTKGEMREEVYQQAIQLFYEHNVSMTRDRTGIMIFISLLERRVEVLADCGINEKVEKGHWDKLVKELVSSIGSGHAIEGIIKSIENCGSILEQNFPIKPDDTNEISNELITDC